jgi:hypothetical protein
MDEDQNCSKDLSTFYPEIVKKIELYFKTVHVPHPWYWNPGESQADFQKKTKTGSGNQTKNKSTEAQSYAIDAVGKK